MIRLYDLTMYSTSSTSLSFYFWSKYSHYSNDVAQPTFNNCQMSSFHGNIQICRPEKRAFLDSHSGHRFDNFKNKISLWIYPLFEISLEIWIFICSEDINECASSPCWNAGTCYDNVNYFTCGCNIKWTGTLCQTLKSCELTCTSNSEKNHNLYQLDIRLRCFYDNYIMWDRVKQVIRPKRSSRMCASAWNLHMYIAGFRSFAL